MAGLGVPSMPKLERTISAQRTSALALLQLRCQERDISDRGSPASVPCPPRPAGPSGTRIGAPVRLVVFDLDETLTLATFLPRGHVFPPEQRDTITTYNFRSPFVDEGDRVEKLKSLLSRIATTIDGERRGIAILSMNQAGVRPIVQLLKAADLDVYFDAIWGMPWNNHRQNGAYRKDDGEWDYFDPPLNEIANHKADILQHLTKDPSRFFPQLKAEAPTRLDYIRTMTLEELVLVDDQRANFQNDKGIRIPRYAKVARYDAQYRGMGNIHDMGGIGAHSDVDFENLSRFVSFPSEFPETIEARCGWERQCQGMDLKRPVRLVVFGFDETLTLATFMPDDKDCKTEVDWKLDPSGEWSEETLVKMNFESPFVREEGSRVDKLREMCRSLLEPVDGQQVRLAVLTNNEAGAVATLNLLRLAGLAEFFDAVWRIPASEVNSGAYRQADGSWRAFSAPASKSFTGLWNVTLAEPPRKYSMELRDEPFGAEFAFVGRGVFTPQGGADKDEEFEVRGVFTEDDRVQVSIDFADSGHVEIEGERRELGTAIDGTVRSGLGEGSRWTAVRKEPDTKTDVLNEIARRPADWFPQLASGAGAEGLQEALRDLRIEDVLLVDDERIIHGRGGACILRYCKVARYDEEHFWDCGFMSELGGLGAKSDKDYRKLESFVRKSHLHLPTDINVVPALESPVELVTVLERSQEDDGRWPKTPRQRSASACAAADERSRQEDAMAGGAELRVPAASFS